MINYLLQYFDFMVPLIKLVRFLDKFKIKFKDCGKVRTDLQTVCTCFSWVPGKKVNRHLL